MQYGKTSVNVVTPLGVAYGFLVNEGFKNDFLSIKLFSTIKKIKNANK